MTAAPPPLKRRATPADLLGYEGKVELINGEIVHIMASGGTPGVIALRVARRLADFVDDFGRGFVQADNIACVVPELSSGRESFVPDVAYYDHDPSTLTMSFIMGHPAFAVEVRSEGDYGRTAERDMAAKRTDYFEAGTQVVWDVDPEAKTVTAYRREAPNAGETSGVGQAVGVGDVLPGWSLSLDWLFR